MKLRDREIYLLVMLIMATVLALSLMCVDDAKGADETYTKTIATDGSMDSVFLHFRTNSALDSTDTITGPTDSFDVSWTTDDSGLNELDLSIFWAGTAQPSSWLIPLNPRRQAFCDSFHWIPIARFSDDPDTVFRSYQTNDATAINDTFTDGAGETDSIIDSFHVCDTDRVVVIYFEKYNGDPVYTTWSDEFPWAIEAVYSPMVSPETTSTCVVTVTVKNNEGVAVEGVYVTAYLPRHNLVDSSGAAIVNTTQYEKTSTYGRAVFQCIWSSYLIPETKWLFATYSRHTGSLKQYITVPRDTVHTFDLSGE